MRTLPAESIRVVVTSPPYNIKNSTGNGLKNGNGGKWPKAALQRHPAIAITTTPCRTTNTSPGSATV